MNQQAAAAAWRNMLQLACLSSLGRLDDTGVTDDCDGSCVLDGGGSCLLHSGLCCPTDSLDNTVVVEFINNEELLEDLAIAALLPPAAAAAADESGDMPRRRLVVSSSSGCNSSSWTATAWHGTTATSSLTAAKMLSPEAVVSRLVVPRRKRDRSGRRRRLPWSLDMPHIPPAPRFNPTTSYRGGAGDDGVRQVSWPPPPPPPMSRRRVRACRHCESTETPQWRAGPEGPGTLCNACGLRYTLNKLLPEYRPSTSPSFQSDRHSNRHRKVVKLREMRNAKDDTVVVGVPAPVVGVRQGDDDDDGEFMDVL